MTDRAGGRHSGKVAGMSATERLGCVTGQTAASGRKFALGGQMILDAARGIIYIEGRPRE